MSPVPVTRPQVGWTEKSENPPTGISTSTESRDRCSPRGRSKTSSSYVLAQTFCRPRLAGSNSVCNMPARSRIVMCMVAVDGLRFKSLGDLIDREHAIAEVPQDLDAGLVAERSKDIDRTVARRRVDVEALAQDSRVVIRAWLSRTPS